MTPFLVFGLPRSRTAWTAYYLRRNSSWVGHDTAIWCKSHDDFFANFSAGMIGTVETGAMLGWKIIRERMPEARIAVIRRPLDEVRRSLMQFGIIAQVGDLETKSRALDEIASHPGVLSVDYGDLYLMSDRRKLFEHCLSQAWDSVWDAQVAPLNIQIDVFERMKTLNDRRSDIQALKAAAA